MAGVYLVAMRFVMDRAAMRLVGREIAAQVLAFA